MTGPVVTNNNEGTSGLSLNASVWFFAGQVDESEPVRHIPIHSTPFRIGRRSDLAFTLPCACVSKEHAEIFERDGAIHLRDLGSTNGTYVNGQRVQSDVVLDEGDLVQFATVVFRVGRENSKTDGFTVQTDACDRALAMMQFDRLISDGGVVPFYQPIVRIADQEIIGYEVLGRSRLFGLSTPAKMFAAASQLSLEAELSREFRLRGVEVASQFPSDAILFVNTHPVELGDDELHRSLRDVRQANEDRRITLEIHEAAVTNPDRTRQLRRTLKELDMQLAFDDFGAGQARLIELSEVQPDYLKFDIKLIKDIHLAPNGRQEVVAALVKMANDLGITSLAEGVEKQEEHEVVQQLGVQLGQGYFYGKPAAITRYLTPVC